MGRVVAGVHGWVVVVTVGVAGGAVFRIDATEPVLAADKAVIGRSGWRVEWR